MPLPAGTRFGSYEIIGLLGAGGMGEVYRARDQKLARDVALKILPSAFAGDPERLTRFEREARVLASLNHPHIAAIYGVEEGPAPNQSTTRALVLELVEGATLAERLDRGPLSLTEALRIGAQIADALDAAHEQGIVHRDLKPANIKVRPDGRVKVLDFGLAKALQAPAAISPGSTPAATITAPTDVTRGGVPLGTVPYMSPEQARGEEVDIRSDVWSFGCVLYEMLTGRAAYQRASVADTLAAIVHQTPDWTKLPDATPAEIRRLLERCLEKDRARRIRDIGEVGLTLSDAGGSSRTAAASSGVSNMPVIRRPLKFTAISTLALLLLLLVVGVLFWRPLGRAERNAPTDPAIQSLAVLPLKPLSEDRDESHIGLGIADSIILGLSRAKTLTVRPTSAVREYGTAGADALMAGAALKVDAVLDGTWQRDADRYRVNLRLLRTSDGASLWSDRVEVHAGDVFALQDQVADRIANRLRAELLPAASGRSRHRPSAEAYELYARGLLYFVQRGYAPAARANSDAATTLFEQAVSADLEFAEAHAMLGFASIWTAIFIEENPSLVDRAETESNLAERLDPSLGQVHMNRALIKWSWYRGWRIVDGILEMRRAIELTPSLSDNELGTLYFHLGLFDQWREMNERSIVLNPTDQRTRSTYVNEFFLANMPQEGLEAQRRLLLLAQPDWRYYLGTGQVKQAAPLLEEVVAKAGRGDVVFSQFALARLRALQGRHEEAQGMVTRLLTSITRNRSYHHFTYTAAQVYALGGKSAETARWLRQTIDEGLPCYPMFSSDPLLDGVRSTPDVKAVLAALKITWDGYITQIRQGGVAVP